MRFKTFVKVTTVTWCCAFIGGFLTGKSAFGDIFNGKPPHNHIECMAKNIYFEARNESTAGKIATSMVVLNRVKSNKFPNDICSVITDAIKYSNGVLVSAGGTDLDTQVLLDNLLLTHKLSGYTNTKVITPITSVASFMSSPSDINVALGIDNTIDISITDPVANKGEGVRVLPNSCKTTPIPDNPKFEPPNSSGIKIPESP